MDIICFHNPDEDNGYLSNWYPSSFTVDGVAFSSMEQFMMYRKAICFGDEAVAAQILSTSDVAKIKSLGRQVSNYDESMWNGIRQIVVYEGLLAKFSQNEELKGKLKATENAVLAECAVKDCIWGIGLSMKDPDRLNKAKWNGQNLLGYALMMVRERLQQDYSWEQRKAKDLCSISTGKSNTQDRVDDGIYPFYVRSPIVEHSNRYLFDEEAVLTVGDGVGTGKVFHYVNGKYDLHQRVYRMFDFSEEITAKYFYYYFSNHFYDRVMAMTAKTSVDSVRYEMIADMDIALPKVKEQMAISDYFERLDNLITLHQRELEKLQNIKKSMLEKMFAQEEKRK